MMKRRCVVFALYFILAPVLLFAQTRQTNSSATEGEASQETRVGTDLHAPDGSVTKDPLLTGITGAKTAIGPGDLLAITVFDTPELSERVRVDSEGGITLPLIGELTVQGTTANALEKAIRSKLMAGSFVKDPQVSVFIMEYAGQMAYVTGEISRPGAYPLLRSHRLLDLISVAGGLTSRAGNTVTIVRGDDPAKHVQVDLTDNDESRRNPEILAGDSITVAQTGIAYVLGDVNRPGGFILDRRAALSVVQAVALAEGAKPSASLSKSVLIRTVEGKRQQIPLNLKMILKSHSSDLLLAAGDIIYIPGSLTHGLGRSGLEVIESSVGLAAVYATRP